MSGADVLFDTNAFIGWVKRDASLARVSVAWTAPAISLFTLGELRFGALKSARPEQNRATVEAARPSFLPLSPDERTADIYATVRFELRRLGKPIPENDLWIAALARQYGLVLLTRDGHFRAVPDLTVTSW